MEALICTACGAVMARGSWCAWHDADGPLHVGCKCPACQRKERHRHLPGVACVRDLCGIGPALAGLADGWPPDGSAKSGDAEQLELFS